MAYEIAFVTQRFTNSDALKVQRQESEWAKLQLELMTRVELQDMVACVHLQSQLRKQHPLRNFSNWCEIDVRWNVLVVKFDFESGGCLQPPPYPSE
jgi:hypothetical protein